jgi:hypothetical protein
MGFLSAFQKKASSNRQAIDKFSAFISNYVQRLDDTVSKKKRSITLIARSPLSPIAHAIKENAQEIEREEIAVQIIFAKLAPVEALIELAAALHITPRGDGMSSIRFIRNPALLNAHEQLALGTHTCWTGDMMRRSENQRNGLDLFEEDAPGSVRLAELAFNAMWKVAKKLPARAFVTPRRLAPTPAALPSALAASELAENSAPIRRTTRLLTRH